MRTHYDAIVVGAGQAGLAAAHRLALGGDSKSRRSVLVLEASDHVGGRTRNYDFGTGTRDVASDDSYELGGTWISPAHSAVLGLCREVGLGVFDASFLDVDDDGGGGRGGGGVGGAGVDRAAAADGGPDAPAVGDDRQEEMPWYYWGMDYDDEDMRRMKRTILHMHPTGAPDGGGEEVPRRATFRTASEFLSALDDGDGRTRSELDAAGRRIDADVRLMRQARGGVDGGPENCWEFAEPGERWADLDSRSTGEVFLGGGNRRSPSSPGGRDDAGAEAEAGAESAMPTTPDARSILRNVIHNKNAEEPEAVSYLYNLMSFGGCNSSGPDTQYRIRGGTQALPLRIAEMLNATTDSRVLLNSPVRLVRVLHGDSGDCGGRSNDDDDGSRRHNSRVQVQTEDGRTFTSDAVIVTGTPPAVGQITFSPPLPPVQRVLLKVPMGRSMKFAAVYHGGPWWRSHGLQGDVLVSGLPRELSVPADELDAERLGELIPILGYCFDLTPYSRRVGVLSCFIEGVGHDHFVGLSRERREGLIRHFLRLTFEGLVGDDGRDRHRDGRPLWEPDEFVVGDWGPGNRFVGGAYTSYFPPRVLSDPDRWDAYRRVEKLPNVFLAGADYHAGFGNGYVEGAVRSGQGAADLILGRL